MNTCQDQANLIIKINNKRCYTITLGCLFENTNLICTLSKCFSQLTNISPRNYNVLPSTKIPIYFRTIEISDTKC